MKNLNEFIRTTIEEFVNNDNLNDNFWAWFGDSKVIDSNGNPIVVYHATNKDFKSFNFKNAGQPIIWFTNDLNAIKNKEVGAAGYDFTKELYVSIKNPCGWNEYEKYGLGQLENMGYDGCILKDNNDTFSGFVFNPNQIKSVKNKGTWNVNSNNIFN